MQQTLNELSSRCRGYLGRLHELVKPINDKYELAVKVALAKTLKYLVVDSENAAVTVKEFLEEKQILRDVLVLSNVPEKPFPKGIQNQL
jgi:chromosome segregation ATPase